MSEEKECPYCYGDGMIFNPHINVQPMTCSVCDGSGVVSVEKLEEFERGIIMKRWSDTESSYTEVKE